MTHRHKYKIEVIDYDDVYVCSCGDTLSADEVVKRLNEAEQLEAELEDWEEKFGEHLDEYNLMIHTMLQENIDQTDIPREGKEGKYKVFHTGTGRLKMLITAYNEQKDEVARLREASKEYMRCNEMHDVVRQEEAISAYNKLNELVNAT